MADFDPKAPLAELVRSLAELRGSSVVVLEITRNGQEIFCEDAATLRADDGPNDVLLAQAVALRSMAQIAEAELGAADADGAFLWNALKLSGMSERVCVLCNRPYLTREPDGAAWHCPPCRG